MNRARTRTPSRTRALVSTCPGFKRAYTWDAIANGYRILSKDDAVKIGDGIWVYFPDGTNVSP